MSKYSPAGDIAAIMALTERNDVDPAVRFALISTLSRYQEQLRMAQNLKASIDEHGSMLSVRDGYGREIIIENPAVKTYTKLTAQADQTLKKLLAIWRTVKK